jgi:hypothetical protein
MKHALLAAAAFAIVATSANAQTFSGTGDPASDAAFSGGSTQATFSAPNQTFASYTENGITISAGRIDSTYANDYNSFGSYYDNAQGSIGTISVSFASPTSAFAFNWGAADIAWTATVLSGAGTLATFNLTPTFASNAKEYFGFSGTGITGFQLVTSDPGFEDWVFVDNITVAGAVGGGVPEPATWALMILGFGAVGGAMRRRQSVAAKVRFA